MIGAFPESGFVVGRVGCTIWEDCPVPLPMFAVDKMGLNIVPCHLRHLEVYGGFDRKIFLIQFPLVYISDHRFGIAPPLGLIEDSIFCSLRQLLADRKCFLQQDGVS